MANPEFSNAELFIGGKKVADVKSVLGMDMESYTLLGYPVVLNPELSAELKANEIVFGDLSKLFANRTYTVTIPAEYADRADEIIDAIIDRFREAGATVRRAEETKNDEQKP